MSELLDRRPVQFASVGLLLMLAGALCTMLFALTLAYRVSIPVVGTQQLLRWAIMAAFVGVAFCFGGAAVWFVDRARP